jgi:hypothetical protein
MCLDTKDGFSCICPPWQDDCTYGKRLVYYRRNIKVILQRITLVVLVKMAAVVLWVLVHTFVNVHMVIMV